MCSFPEFSHHVVVDILDILSKTTNPFQERGYQQNFTDKISNNHSEHAAVVYVVIFELTQTRRNKFNVNSIRGNYCCIFYFYLHVVPYHHEVIQQWMDLEDTAIDPVESGRTLLFVAGNYTVAQCFALRSSLYYPCRFFEHLAWLCCVFQRCILAIRNKR